MKDIDYNKGGYGRHGLRAEKIEEIHSRAMDPNTGKVYRGEAGKNLRRRLVEKQVGEVRRAEVKNQVFGIR